MPDFRYQTGYLAFEMTLISGIRIVSISGIRPQPDIKKGRISSPTLVIISTCSTSITSRRWQRSTICWDGKRRRRCYWPNTINPDLFISCNSINHVPSLSLGILRDKTMDDEYMYSSFNDKHYYPFCGLKLKVLALQINKPINQDLIKVPIVLSHWSI